MNVPKLLTIIVTYNGIKWIEKCLSSVKDASIKSDIFIVDNGSTDGTIKFIKDKYPEVHFIISKENLGFGKANNLGFKFATENNYDYAYLLNQDAWVEEDTFQKIIKIYTSYPQFGIISPLQVNKSKNKLDNNFLEYCCPKEMLSDFVCQTNLLDIYETCFVMAAHWLIPIEVIKKVGGFSPTFKLYGEDDNYIDRLHYWGYKVGIMPYVKGIHDREYREESKKKKMHITVMHWRDYLSNPICPLKQRYLKFLKSYVLTFLKNPCMSIIGLFQIIKDLQKINKNLKISMQEMAFLN